MGRSVPKAKFFRVLFLGNGGYVVNPGWRKPLSSLKPDKREGFAGRDLESSLPLRGGWRKERAKKREGMATGVLVPGEKFEKGRRRFRWGRILSQSVFQLLPRGGGVVASPDVAYSSARKQYAQFEEFRRLTAGPVQRQGEPPPCPGKSDCEAGRHHVTKGEKFKPSRTG